MDTSLLTKTNIQRWIFEAAEGKLDLTLFPFLSKRYNSIQPERSYYRFFHLLTLNLKPSLVVELGAWRGTGAAFFASGNPQTRVITIDHHTDPGDEEHKKACLEVVDHYPNVNYWQGWTWDVAPKIKDFGTIDILFIDSWHVYEYAVKDWNTYKQLLSPKALVLCDDILSGGKEGDPIYGMDRFWEELPGEKFLTRILHTGFPMGILFYDDSKS